MFTYRFSRKNEVITNRYCISGGQSTFTAGYVHINELMASVGETVTIFFLRKYGGCLHAFNVRKIDENSYAFMHLFLLCS